jgi:hypothetical protein
MTTGDFKLTHDAIVQVSAVAMKVLRAWPQGLRLQRSSESANSSLCRDAGGMGCPCSGLRNRQPA